MAAHKYAGEIEAGDEIAVMPGMLPPTVIQEVRDAVEPDFVKLVLSTDTADPDSAFDWPRDTIFTVTYDSAAAKPPEV